MMAAATGPAKDLSLKEEEAYRGKHASPVQPSHRRPDGLRAHEKKKKKEKELQDAAMANPLHHLLALVAGPMRAHRRRRLCDAGVFARAGDLHRTVLMQIRTRLAAAASQAVTTPPSVLSFALVGAIR